MRGTGPGGGERGAGVRPRDWSRRLDQALAKDLFVLHAQPIVDVASGRTVRHELFLRLAAGATLVPAGDFVFAAEELGSIGEIDRWVVGRAIGLAAAGHALDLNVSVRSADQELLDLIREGTAGAGVDPGQIVLELAEGQLTAAPKPGARFVRGAHELGCGIALDGFVQGGRGTVLLRNLPIDFVKLGSRFVQGLADDGRRRRKARNAAAKAHENGQRVIAQGIEDLITLQLLQDLGIDEAQGYALGATEPVESALSRSA